MMNQYKNPYDNGWRAWLTLLVGITIISLGAYGIFIHPKLEICEVYYKEISKLSCFVSSYGLPPRGSR